MRLTRNSGRIATSKRGSFRGERYDASCRLWEGCTGVFPSGRHSGPTRGNTLRAGGNRTCLLLQPAARLSR
jgi:hypothetical protein